MGLAAKLIIIGQSESANQMIQNAIASNPEWQHSLFEFQTSFKKGLKEMSISEYHTILIDCDSFKPSPLEILFQARQVNRQTPIILLNKPGFEKQAVACLKNGADYYLVKDENWQNDLPLIMDNVIREGQERQKLRIRIAKLRSENQNLKSKQIMNHNTQMYSQKHFMTLLAREINRASRYNQNLSCLVLEVTGIKTKDTKDETYEKLALYLKSIVRNADIWSQLAPNRFAALLPNTTSDQTQQTIDRLSSELTGFRPPHPQQTLDYQWGAAHFNQDHIIDEKDLLTKAENELNPRDLVL